jgi:hypothetical protein
MALAQGDMRPEEQALAERYVPVLYFHPAELYRPQPVEVMIGSSRLRQARPYRVDSTVLRRVTNPDLARYSDESYSLDFWLGDQVSSDHRNYSAHRGFYASTLSPDAGRPPPLTYAHMVRDESGRVSVQYWLFYLYNDFFNKHEGDWEMVQVLLDPAGKPEWLVLSQHEGGTRRPWGEATIEEETHPAVYVALGSHANYFWGNETYIRRLAFGNARLDIPDRTGTAGRTFPEVVLIPDREEIAAHPTEWVGFEWLLFRGRWGEMAPRPEFRGPLGPAYKGEQWERPLDWGLKQPLDTDTWYANRLRVGISVREGDRAWVTLRSGGTARLPGAEALGDLALLHDDPVPGTVTLAIILPGMPAGQVGAPMGVH